MAGLALDYRCRRCRRSGLLIADGLCFDCLAHDRVNLLRADGRGVLPARLRPLIPALLSADTGQAVWRWLDPRKAPAQLVGQIATSADALSHDLLDTMPPSQSLHRLLVGKAGRSRAPGARLNQCCVSVRITRCCW